MQLQLADNCPIWGLLDLKFFLTQGEPGPKEINWDALGGVHRHQILQALRMNQIISDIDAKTLIERELGGVLEEDSKRRQMETVSKAKLPETVRTDELETVAEKYLAMGAQSLRPHIVRFENPRLVNLMLKLESDSKKRKSVLGWLHDKKRNIEAGVLAEMQKEVKGLSGVRKDRLADSFYQAIEDVQEEVKVSVDLGG